MPTVYRVEHPRSHYGPFHHNNSIYAITKHWDYYESLPGTSDFDSFDCDNEIIAVKNPCQLFFWFGYDFDFILLHFSIYKIKVKNYREGNSGNQVAIDRRDIISKRKLIK